MASKVSFIYPDVFDGTAYMGGVLHYRKIDLPGREMVSGIFPEIPEKLRKFSRRWKGLPAQEKVRAELKKIAHQEFARLKNQQHISSQDIRSFYNKCTDRHSASISRYRGR